MDLTKLSNDELTKALDTLAGNEREVSLKILYHLIELERRELFKELGYSSLFDYCLRHLRYAEGAAFRRITAARCIKDAPELAQLFLQGKVTLSTIAAASKSIKEGVTAVSEIVGISHRQVQSLVALHSPVNSKPRERVKSLCVKLEEVKEERFELRFSVSKEVYLKLKEATDKLSNSLGDTLSMEAVMGKLLEGYLKPKGERRGQTQSNTRYIPSAVKRAVFQRDRCCSYVSPDGTRCQERRYLHIDHIQPYALGGKSELRNLRLLCSTHNQFLARKTFGDSFRRH